MAEIQILSDLMLGGALIMGNNETEFPANPRIGTFIIKDQCLYGYIKIGSLETWYPFASKTNSYVHSQGIPNLTWTVTHNLGTTNLWIQVKDHNGNIINVGKRDVNENSFTLNFTAATKGTVVVVAPDSVEVPQMKASVLNVGANAVIIDSSGVKVNGSYVLTSANIESIAATAATNAVQVEVDRAIAAESLKADKAVTYTKTEVNDAITAATGSLGTASTKNVAVSGNASDTQVVMGNDSRLSDARIASDVYAWAKETIKPSYNQSEISGLSTVASTGKYTDLSNTPTLGTSADKDVATSGNASDTQVVMGNDSRLFDARVAGDVYAWAKAPAKPEYSYSELLSKPTTISGYGITDAYTKTEVNTAIQNVVGAAPAALDTLKEIADQLANDESAVSALTTVVSGKQATLVSGTNIKTINGTTLLGSGDLPLSTVQFNNQTTAYTVVASDLGKVINCTSGTFTVSLTAAATLGEGFNVTIWNMGTGTITIAPNAGETIDGKASFALQTQNGLTIVSNGAGWYSSASKAFQLYSEKVDFNVNINKPAATGFGSVAIGSSASSSGQYGLAIGRSSNASGIGGVAIGFSTASGNNSISICNATGTFQTIASATNSTAIGGNSANLGSQAVTGAGAMALGGSYASGIDSFAAAIANNSSMYGATGNWSIAMGLRAKAGAGGSIAIGSDNLANSTYSTAIGMGNTATGNGSAAIGYTNTASSAYSVAMGNSNAATGIASVAMGNGSTASNNYSVALGNLNTASGIVSIATGYYSASVQYGKLAHASGRFTTIGDAQNGKLVLRALTTNATTTALTSDQAVTSASNQVILSNNQAMAFRGQVCARQSVAGADVMKVWEIKGAVRRGATAASTSLVGSAIIDTIAQDTGAAAWTITVTADTTNGGVSFAFTGEAGKNIACVATVETTEVIYA